MKHQPYADGRRPSRAKVTAFVVDGLGYLILGVRDPSMGCMRPAMWPDSPDDEIGEALCMLVKYPKEAGR